MSTRTTRTGGSTKSDKALNQRAHALRRLNERFDLKLNMSEYKEMCRLIKHEQSELIEKQSARIRVHKIIFKGREIFAVYDKKRSVIVTVLKNCEGECRQTGDTYRCIFHRPGKFSSEKVEVESNLKNLELRTKESKH